MKQDANAEGTRPADTVRLAAAGLLVVAGIAGYYLLSGQAVWLRWVAVAAGLATGALVFALSPRGRDTWQFVLDSRIELRKVYWPNRQETGMTTLVVFVFVIVMAVFFWLLDLGLAWATRALTGQGG
ncbi:MAG: preprotein translocase subunit SecE [Gammaproteobacteria bacterium]|nr:preprotein translocase subunit SecE [Gammaproteobacteria bacterium]